MSNTFFLSCCVFLFIGLPDINAQDSEGVPCETPNEEYGLCINIYNCSSLMHLMLTQSANPRVRTFLKTSACGSVGNIPLVCCPDKKTEPENPIFTSSSTTYRTPSQRTAQPTPNSVLLTRPQCGYSNNSNSRVVNGVPAKLGEFPWIVALGYKNSKNPNAPKWLCGGTLITETHILTAAHCVYNRQDLYIARLGDLDLYSDDDGAAPETIPLVNAKIHEGFNAINFTNDIAILKLSYAPQKTTAWPICLPLENSLRSNEFKGSHPTVAGWGSIYFNGPSSPTLMKVALPVIDNDKCKTAYGARSIIDERVLCAGYLRGGKDACQGDSGGPLMHRTVDKEAEESWFYLIGVVSYGLRCAEAGYPGVYTRVTMFLNWIQRNLI